MICYRTAVSQPVSSYLRCYRIGQTTGAGWVVLSSPCIPIRYARGKNNERFVRRCSVTPPCPWTLDAAPSLLLSVFTCVWFDHPRRVQLFCIGCNTDSSNQIVFFWWHASHSHSSLTVFNRWVNCKIESCYSLRYHMCSV